jgi:putative oxidoreductase
MSVPFIDRFAIARWAPIPLRLIIGYGFMEHGFAKLAKGPDAFAHILQAISVPVPLFMAWSTILVEILGGLAVILGAFVTLASLPMAAVLLVAMFTVHLPYGFSSIKIMAVTAGGAQFGPPGYEVDLLYLACLSALVLSGSGPLAIDGLLTMHRKVGNHRPRQKSSSADIEQSGTDAANRNLDGNKEKTAGKLS